MLAALAALAAAPGAAAQPRPPVRHVVLAADASAGRIAMIDERGETTWQAGIEQLHDLQVLDDGNVLFQTSWTRLVETTTDGEVVWTYDAAERHGNRGRRVEVHAFRRLADGVTMIAESGPARILEVDRAGRLLREVPLRVDHPDPHRDTRLVRKLQSGHYLVAHEGDGAVREYDAAGRVVWEYEVPLFGRPRAEGSGPDAWGNRVFAAVRLPSGNTLLSTGNGHSVLEVNPQKEIVWHLRQDDLPGIRLAWVTTVEVLPNGHYLIGNCHAGPGQPQIVEITRDKRVVWTFEDFERFGNGLSNSTLVDLHRDALFYRREVQPVLEANCYRCHGTRDKEVKGELWLRARTNVVRGGHSGAVVDLVDPERSRILRYLRHEDPEHRMPPKKKLADADLAVLTDWVHRGVPMEVVEDEWTYEPPGPITDEARAFWSFQPVRDPAPPAVRDAGWCRDDLDRFVKRRLEDAGLEPNPEADRVAFVRRATFDLLGLPPTPAEVAAFVADRSPGAHARLIDRLLASPHYGERWGRHWLDLVRFAETNGYERDAPKPEAWRYRQYVVDAFNRDLPYDRFVLEQLAGDELDDGGEAAVTATGYYRLGLWDDEPADALQSEFDGYDDIVRTTAETFLGLTVGCARCHDHKLDPIPQRDYYGLLAFFRNVRPYSKNDAHVLTDVSTAEERAAAARANEEVRERRRELTGRRLALRDRFAGLWLQQTGAGLSISDLSELRYEFYRDTWTALPDFDRLKPEATGPVPRQLFDLGLATREHAFGFVFRGRIFAPADGAYTFELDSDDGARLSVGGAAVVTYDGVHGLGQPRRGTVELRAGHHEVRLDYFQGHGGHGLRVSWSGPGFEARALSAPDAGETRQRLERAIAGHGARLLGAADFEEYRRLGAEIEALAEVRPERRVLSVREPGPDAPPTHVLVRGSPHAPAARVEPAFPRILTEAPPDIRPRASSSGRRLALARWLVDPRHPLTARVLVNRVWQHHFGRGIVRSSSDFGMHGTPPTHPELLDFLARRTVEGGWTLKPLHRRIMLSSTYRMSSRAREDGLLADPTNDLLWRFDLRRLSAEEIRDAILSVTGALDPRVGGPSVYPEFPREVLEGQSRVTWQGDGSPANNSRRSLYTFVKRSLLDPFLESFDLATTDTPCAVRFQTTQPTQALTMINGAFVNRSARRLAERLVREVGPDPRRRIERAWELATGRRPTEDEAARGLRFLRTFPGPGGDALALRQYCLIVLNLNELLFVD